MFGRLKRDKDSDEAGYKREPVRPKGLSLYGYPQCPFCRRVTSAMDALGLEIPLRNTLSNPEYQRELVEALGQSTVPVLLIEGNGGDRKWLPESADIVQYLTRRFAADA